MAHLMSKLPPEIQAKFAAIRARQRSVSLTYEECRTVVRTLRVMILMEPHREAELEVNLNRIAKLARFKRKRELKRARAQSEPKNSDDRRERLFRAADGPHDSK